jgi:hypothetical protein
MLWGSIVCQTKEESIENEFKSIKIDCPTQSVFLASYQFSMLQYRKTAGMSQSERFKHRKHPKSNSYFILMLKNSKLVHG